ncbi:hypothetical protein H5410_060835 [Solanum commersonii]|uniref:Secreted protein n=1 Tax=Solanum commersonii TaxID=4109 RepID=A0A9J5W644_SOLCO|nr:hypothetical protein H5410_060835 [Solanum commersonii]
MPLALILGRRSLAASTSLLVLGITSSTGLSAQKSSAHLYKPRIASSSSMTLFIFSASSNNTRLLNTGSSVAFMASFPWETTKQWNNGNHCSLIKIFNRLYLEGYVNAVHERSCPYNKKLYTICCHD